MGDDNYCTVIVSGPDFIRVKLYIRTCPSVIRPTFNDKVVSLNDKVVCGWLFRFKIKRTFHFENVNELFTGVENMMILAHGAQTY